MSSLQSIMNMDEDQQDTSTHADNKGSGTPAPASRGHDPSSSSTPSSHVIRSGQQPIEIYQQQQQQHLIPLQQQQDVRSSQQQQHRQHQQQPAETDPGSSSTVQQGKRRIPSREPRASKSTAASSSASTSTRPATSRRRSTASVDSMEHQGYGSGASSASMGGPGMGGPSGGGGFNPNQQPTRPMPMGSPSTGEIPVRLTPITGRVSRAKKGIAVHTCELCNPPKTFTRAEHLRRHQLSHQTPRYPCTYPGCDRAFHRPDLLSRHQQRHEQEGDKASGGADESSPRGSIASGASASLEDRMPGLRMGGGLQPPSGFPSTPGSASEIPPSTPNMGDRGFQHDSPSGSAAGSTMSPGMGGGGEYGYGGTGYALDASRMDLSPEPPNFNNIDYHAPRTDPVPLFVVTRNLSPSTALHVDNPPELTHGHDYSPWTSASDSNYSTPSDMSRNHRYWTHHRSTTSMDWTGNNSLLSPFPPSAGGSSGLDTMAAPYYMTSPFPMTPHLASPAHNTYGNLLDPSLMGGFADDPTHDPFMDTSAHPHHNAHFPHRSSSSVRSPTLQSAPASAQSAETLVTPVPLPHRIDMMANLGRKEMVLEGSDVGIGMLGGGGGSPNWGGSSPGGGGILEGSGLGGLGGCGIGGITLVAPLPRSVRNAIPSYLDVYWARFHHLYPFVHRHTLEGSGEDVLRCAMAAVATQFLDGKEDRARGNLLHEYAWQEAKRHPQWSLQVMQAILLCELFARFRGRKAVVRPSKLFESLYSRVLDHNSTMFDPAHAGSAQHSMGVNGSNNEFINLSMTKEERWHNWLETEGRRRLLASCFLIDGHTSVYHGQARARDDILHSEIPLTGPSDTLWAANSADEWAATLDTNPSAGIPQFLPHPASLTPEGVAERSIFDQCAILNAEARNLPRNDNVSSVMSHQQSGNTGRESSLGAAEERIGWLFRGLPISGVSNTFLALHHTPLRDLLAVSGDSWVFSQKVLEQPTFAEYQRRLRLWLNNSNTSGSNPANLFASSAPTSALDVGNMSVGKATIYASRALLAFLNRPTESNGITPRAACVSDYWAMYVCALIIWAFGRHRAGRSPSSNNSGDSVPSSATSSNTNNHGESEERAVNWLRAVSELSRPEDVTRVRGRREASLGVVGLVKRRLEADCVPGSRARLYVDAVGVLRKLEEGVNWKWF